MKNVAKENGNKLDVQHPYVSCAEQRFEILFAGRQNDGCQTNQINDWTIEPQVF